MAVAAELTTDIQQQQRSSSPRTTIQLVFTATNFQNIPWSFILFTLVWGSGVFCYKNNTLFLVCNINIYPILKITGRGLGEAKD